VYQILDTQAANPKTNSSENDDKPTDKPKRKRGFPKKVDK
jgi:hypothetical protein